MRVAAISSLLRLLHSPLPCTQYVVLLLPSLAYSRKICYRYERVKFVVRTALKLWVLHVGGVLFILGDFGVLVEDLSYKYIIGCLSIRRE